MIININEPSSVHQRLATLKFRLDQITQSWAVDDYQDLLKFFVDILPKIMEAERASIFVKELGADKIWSMLGTGLEAAQIKPPRNRSIVGKAISTGQTIIEYDLDKRNGYHTEIDAITGFVTRNLICAPIKSQIGNNTVVGAIEVLNKQGGKIFTQEEGERLRDIARLLSMAIENILINKEILQVSNQINLEVERFEIKDFREVRFIAESPKIRSILDRVRIISKTPVNVLIQGEHGTGKELIARIIHENSDRRDKPFVAVNCAAIPEGLVESEFFGYEKGAFTGAYSSHRGRFEEADGGILLMDEIAEMPITVQPKFLRVIQEGEGCRLGSNKLRHYDLRIISSTNKNLRQEVDEGHFREDLFFRLFSVDIHIPPLRERREDIIPMARTFLDQVTRRFNKKVADFSPKILNLFEDYPWPGNVRQLLHEVEHTVALTPEGEGISLDECSQELQDFIDKPKREKLSGRPLAEQVMALEVKLITKALQEAAGKKYKAAELLGITRQGLHKKIKRYGIG